MRSIFLYLSYFNLRSIIMEEFGIYENDNTYQDKYINDNQADSIKNIDLKQYSNLDTKVALAWLLEEIDGKNNHDWEFTDSNDDQFDAWLNNSEEDQENISEMLV